MRQSWIRRAKLCFIILAITALSSAIGGVVPSGGTVDATNLASLGAYTGYQSPNLVSSFGRAIGNQPMFAMDFLDGTSWSTIVDGSSAYMSAWKGKGYTMVWGVPMLPGSFSPDSNASDTSGSAYGLQQGAAGHYNSYFLKLAQDMVAGGQGSSIVRIGWEFNGDWFPWSAKGQAAAFVGYWQQIVDTMRSVPGQNFTFEWNPTAGDEGVGNLASYYPGDAYVDYVGIDLYDEAWANYTGIASQWNTYLTEQYGLNWIASFAASTGKPITLPEWGLEPDSTLSDNGGAFSRPGTEVGGGDDPTFINDMAQWIRQHDVFDASFWDYGSSRLSLTSNPASFAAFILDFGDLPSAPPTTSTTTTTPTTTTTTTPTTTTPTTTTPTTTTPTTPTTTTPTTTTPTTGDNGNSSTPTSIGDGASTGSDSGASSSSPAVPPGGQSVSTVTIDQPGTPVVPTRKAHFVAHIRTASHMTGRLGRVTWRVTNRYGSRVPCTSDSNSGGRSDDTTRCTVPAGSLSAGSGPYAVSVLYSGSQGVAPSVATVTEPVERGESQVRMTSKILPGNQKEIIATVSGQSSGSGQATGAVRFGLWSWTGPPPRCLNGNTAALTSGKATCVLQGTTTARKVYFVRAMYNGDANFGASFSNSVGVVVPARASAQVS